MSTVEVRHFLASKNFDPFEKLIQLYEHKETDHATRVRIAIELAQYTAPKLRSMDINADVKSQSITVVLGVPPKQVAEAVTERETRLLGPRKGSCIRALSDSDEVD